MEIKPSHKSSSGMRDKSKPLLRFKRVLFKPYPDQHFLHVVERVDYAWISRIDRQSRRNSWSKKTNGNSSADRPPSEAEQSDECLDSSIILWFIFCLFYLLIITWFCVQCLFIHYSLGLKIWSSLILYTTQFYRLENENARKNLLTKTSLSGWLFILNVPRDVK